MLDYNTTNFLDMPSKNNKEDISLRASNISKERIRPVDMNNDEKDIRPADIDKKMLATPNWTSQNSLLSKLSSTFREITFNKSEFSAGTLVLDTRYKHPRSQNNNLFYLFNGQLDYALAYYFVDLEITKHNIDKFFTNPLIKPITKDLLYCNVDE